MEKSIFDTVKLPYLKLKNRIIRSATWEALAKPDGSPSTPQIEIYRELAAGGVGGIIAGFTSVAEDDNYFYGMARLSSDALIKPWSQVTSAAHQYDCPILTQLALGEYRQNGKAYEPNEAVAGQIKEIINLFGEAARRAGL